MRIGREAWLTGRTRRSLYPISCTSKIRAERLNSTILKVAGKSNTFTKCNSAEKGEAKSILPAKALCLRTHGPHGVLWTAAEFFVCCGDVYWTEVVT